MHFAMIEWCSFHAYHGMAIVGGQYNAMIVRKSNRVLLRGEGPNLTSPLLSSCWGGGRRRVEKRPTEDRQWCSPSLFSILSRFCLRIPTWQRCLKVKSVWRIFISVWGWDFLLCGLTWHMPPSIHPQPSSIISTSEEDERGGMWTWCWQAQELSARRGTTCPKHQVIVLLESANIIKKS